jgi:hypothetical protein
VDGVFGADAARVVAVGPLGVDGTTFRIGVDAAFPGHLPFPVRVRGATWAISLGGTPVGRGRGEQAFVVEPGRGGTGHFELAVPAARVPGVLAALAGGADEVEVEGEVEIDPIGPVRRVPFRVRAPLPRP